MVEGYTKETTKCTCACAAGTEHRQIATHAAAAVRAIEEAQLHFIHGEFVNTKKRCEGRDML